jgi:hypothetical protein
VKDRIRYYFEDQLIEDAGSFNYVGIIICSDLNWADHVNYTQRKAWGALHFIRNAYTKKKGNNNMKRLVYKALVRPILEYGTVCGNPHREGQVSALNRVQMRAAKFANNINESVWETLAQRRLIARICILFKAHAGRRARKAIGNIFLKLCYLSREDHNRKMRTRKQRTDVGVYSFVNRPIKSWNQLPAGLLASFVCEINVFRKRVKNVVISKGIQLEIECKYVK